MLDQDRGAGRRPPRRRSRSGQSWDAVAKKYSTDPTTKNNGRAAQGVTKGQEDQALDTAAFSAQVNKIGGPVKGQFGYYVFEVTKITKPTQQSLAQATPLIQQTLRASSRRAPRTRSTAGQERAWLSQTKCRSSLRDGGLQRLQGAEDLDHRPPQRAPTHFPTDAARHDDRVSPSGAAADAGGAGAPRGDHEQAPDRVPVGPRAGRALDRPAHGRGGLRARRRRAACDDHKLLDELGDVLFQVHFLSLLLEERGAGSLAEVTEHCTEKLIRRHPHVFGEA